MYGGVVISKLTSKSDFAPINTLQDLVNRPEMKILVQRKSFVDDNLKDSIYFPSLKSRIEYFDEKESSEEMKNLLLKLVLKTHVMIDSKVNFHSRKVKLLAINGTYK